jgi:WD40 repeat protein
MRMIEGESLRDAIVEFHREKEKMDAGDRSLRLRSLLQRFASVCDALSYAHSQDVLHRDIKPDNIMLGKHGETLLVDWGLATRIGELEEFEHSSSRGPEASESLRTEVGRVLGTLLFMSPEQAAGEWEIVCEFSDIFSMGATLFALLTGQAPYDKSAEDLIGDVMKGRVRKVLDIAPMVSPPLAAICHRAIAATPEDRYVDARELAEDIERWLADEPVLAYSEPIGDRVSRFTRRHRGSVVIGVIAMTAITLASLVALAWVSRVRTNTQIALERSEQLRLNAEIRAYSGEIGIAQLAVNSGSPERAASVLEETDPSFRDWGFQYLSHQVGRGPQTADELVKFAKQDGTISDAVFVADDALIATASFDSTIRIWGKDPAKAPKILEGHSLEVLDLDASPDGLRIASASADQTVRIWDVNSAQQVAICEGHSDKAQSVCFSPDGARLVSASSSGEIFVWNASSGELQCEIEGKVNDQTSLDVSTSGETIVVGGEHDSVDLFDLSTGKHVRSLSIHPEASHVVHCVRFSPDGTQVLAGGDRKVISIWDVETGDLRTTMTGHTETITSVRMSANGDRVLSASLDGTVRLWDPITAQPTLSFSDLTDGFKQASFSDDGSKLLWVSEGKTVSVLNTN